MGPKKKEPPPGRARRPRETRSTVAEGQASSGKHSASGAFVHVSPFSSHVREGESSEDEAYGTGSKQKTTDQPSTGQHHPDSGIIVRSSFSDDALTQEVEDEKRQSEEAVYEASSRPDTLLNHATTFDECPHTSVSSSPLSDDVLTQDTNEDEEETVCGSGLSGLRVETLDYDAVPTDTTSISIDLYGTEFVSRNAMIERPPKGRYLEPLFDEDDGLYEFNCQPFTCNAEVSIEPLSGSYACYDGTVGQ